MHTFRHHLHMHQTVVHRPVSASLAWLFLLIEATLYVECRSISVRIYGLNYPDLAESSEFAKKHFLTRVIDQREREASPADKNGCLQLNSLRFTLFTFVRISEMLR